MNLKKLFVSFTLLVSVISLSSFGIKAYVDYEVLNTLEDMKEWVEYDMAECTDSCMTSKLDTYKLNLDFCIKRLRNQNSHTKRASHDNDY